MRAYEGECGYGQGSNSRGMAAALAAADAVVLTAENQHLRKSIENSDRDYWFARCEALTVALEEIRDRPPVELNPDGVDQAAFTMQLIAREALGDG